MSRLPDDNTNPEVDAMPVDNTVRSIAEDVAFGNSPLSATRGEVNDSDANDTAPRRPTWKR